MRFLVDNALSPIIAVALSDAGHDAVHLRERGLQAEPDTTVFELAEREDRVIVSADTDFGALLAARDRPRPSFVLFRRTSGLRPSGIASQLLEIAKRYESRLKTGCIVTVRDDRIRVRRLPIE